MTLQPFISEAGAEELASLRIGKAPKPTGHAPIELLARVPSEECGCPEELWSIDGIIYLIHMEEAVGTGEIFTFAGDEETERTVSAITLDHLRAAMFRQHAELRFQETCIPLIDCEIRHG